MARIYLDTNVFVSFIRQEIGKPLRLFFKDAEDFFLSCEGKHVLVLSDLFFSEIEKVIHYPKSDVLEFFRKIRVQVEVFEFGSLEVEKAREFLKLGLHWLDALHAAIALNSKCDFIASFNLSDFLPVERLIPARLPSDLIN